MGWLRAKGDRAVREPPLHLGYVLTPLLPRRQSRRTASCSIPIGSNPSHAKTINPIVTPINEPSNCFCFLLMVVPLLRFLNVSPTCTGERPGDLDVHGIGARLRLQAV